MATFPTPESQYRPPLDAPGILLAEELSEIAERAQTFTAATGVIIALRRNNELVVRTSNGIAPDVGACIPLPSGVTGLCVTTKKPQTCASADAEAQLEQVFRAISVRSVLSVPVPWDGEVRGVLVVLAQMPEAFNRTHIAILMTLRDVIANKLSQCELPSDAPQPAPVPEKLIELDVDSLLKAPAPQPTVVKQAAAVPLRARPVPIQAPTPLTPPHVESASARPSASAEPKSPVTTSSLSQPAMKPLAELFKQPAELPIGIHPDVLCPGDDPGKYGSLQKPKLIVEPVVPTVLAAVEPPSNRIFAAYHVPAKSNRSSPLVFAAAAIVVLGLSIGLYSRRKPAAPAIPTNVAVQEIPAPAPTVVPLPKSAPEQAPVAERPKVPTSSAVSVKHEDAKRTVEEPKQTAEETVQEPVPILHLAASKPAAKSEEPIAPPVLTSMAASGKGLPDLGTVSPAGRLPVHQATVVAATLVRGPSPQYPQAARQRGVSGTVKLHITISAEGKVTDVRVLSGDALLAQASMSAVRGWVYRPASLDGKAVPSTAEVSLRFTGSK